MDSSPVGPTTPPQPSTSDVHPALIVILFSSIVFTTVVSVYLAYEQEETARAIGVALAQLSFALQVLIAFGFLPPKK